MIVFCTLQWYNYKFQFIEDIFWLPACNRNMAAVTETSSLLKKKIQVQIQIRKIKLIEGNVQLRSFSVYYKMDILHLTSTLCASKHCLVKYCIHSKSEVKFVEITVTTAQSKLLTLRWLAVHQPQSVSAPRVPIHQRTGQDLKCSQCI